MGAVTVGVSLPRDWVSERDLVVGSPVGVRIGSGGAIVIRPVASEPTRIRGEIEVAHGAPPEHLFRELVGLYLRGVEQFVVTAPGGLDPETRATVRAFQRRTLHPQIVFEDRERMVLSDLVEGASLALPVLLRRMFQVVVGMHEDAERSWTAHGALPAEPMETRDDEVDRYAWLVERTLAVRLRDSVEVDRERGALGAPLSAFLLSRCLERIADHAVLLADHGARLREASIPASATRAISTYHRQAVDHLRSALSVAERPDPATANEVLDAATALEATHAALMERLVSGEPSRSLPTSAVAAVGFILQSIDRTIAYARDIAQLGLSRDGGPVRMDASFERSSSVIPRGATSR